MTDPGSDRIAGSAKEISGLKDAYNRGEYPLKETTDIHAVCDLIKSWFRVLPESVFPPSAYRDVMEAMRTFADFLLGLLADSKYRTRES